MSTIPLPDYPDALNSNGKNTGLLISGRHFDHPGLDGEIATVIKEYIELLREQGHVVEPVEFDL